MPTSLKDLLQYMVDRDASDIYLTEALPPMFRIECTVERYGDELLTAGRHGSCCPEHNE